MSIFATREASPARNMFPLRFNNLMSIQDFGVLYPILCKPLVPGDVYRHRHATSMWFFPMSANVQHNYKFKTYYFFVPNRIVMSDWDKFLPEGLLPMENEIVPCYVQIRDLYNRHPTGSGVINNNGGLGWWMRPCSLADYLNHVTLHPSQGNAPVYNSSTPLESTFNSSVDDRSNTLAFRAYQRIWRDYFVDEQVSALVDECNSLDNIFKTNGGEDVNTFASLFSLRSKSWQYDRFTTALPEPDKPNVIPSLQSNFTIEDFRKANSLTQFIEKLGRIGSRIQEFTRGIYGVTPKDYRLDMAEFLCASSTDIVKGTIYNNQATSGASLPSQQSYMVSTAKSGDVAGGFTYKCREHGHLIGLCVLEPQPVYYQGQDRMFMRMSPNDFFIPGFENIGDEAILNKEVYYKFVAGNELPGDDGEIPSDKQNKGVFAYSPRDSQFKYYDNQVHGYFRTTGFLDYHDAKSYSQLWPRDSKEFSQIQLVSTTSSAGGAVYDDSNLKRVFAINSGAPIAGLNVFHDFKSLRPMQYNAIPRITSK